MTSSKRKSKMISFRLSPEEYAILLQACEQRGIRSISELARTAMYHWIADTSPNNGNGHANGSAVVGEQVRDLRDRVKSISAELDRLVRSVEDHNLAELCTTR